MYKRQKCFETLAPMLPQEKCYESFMLLFSFGNFFYRQQQRLADCIRIYIYIFVVRYMYIYKLLNIYIYIYAGLSQYRTNLCVGKVYKFSSQTPWSLKLAALLLWQPSSSCRNYQKPPIGRSAIRIQSANFTTGLGNSVALQECVPSWIICENMFLPQLLGK